MSIVLKGSYKGYELETSSVYNGILVKVNGESVHRADTVERAEEWIDRTLKKKFKRIQIITSSDWNTKWANAKQGVISSVLDNGEVWVVFDKGQCKRRMIHLYELSTHNLTVIEELKTAELAIEALRKKISQLESTLVCITPASIFGNR